jgi:diguanylate cyclase (GGDEF)-like protein
MTSTMSTTSGDFASLNHRHGHDAGDDVLSAWETTLNRNLPPGADAARVGGDEYLLVVLPGLSVQQAVIVLDEIRSDFAPLEIWPHALRNSVSVVLPPTRRTGKYAARVAN